MRAQRLSAEDETHSALSPEATAKGPTAEAITVLQHQRDSSLLGVG
jgi:hypothetical protein